MVLHSLAVTWKQKPKVLLWQYEYRYGFHCLLSLYLYRDNQKHTHFNVSHINFGHWFLTILIPLIWAYNNSMTKFECCFILLLFCIQMLAELSKSIFCDMMFSQSWVTSCSHTRYCIQIIAGILFNNLCRLAFVLYTDFSANVKQQFRTFEMI